jgi:aspartyl-tRNA synthetase
MSDGPVKNVDSSSSNLYVAHRTHNCGELRKEHVGQKVTIAGWVQFHRVEGKFLVIRDGYGSVQAIISDEVCAAMTNQVVF